MAVENFGTPGTSIVRLAVAVDWFLRINCSRAMSGAAEILLSLSVTLTHNQSVLLCRAINRGKFSGRD